MISAVWEKLPTTNKGEITGKNGRKRAVLERERSHARRRKNSIWTTRSHPIKMIRTFLLLAFVIIGEAFHLKLTGLSSYRKEVTQLQAFNLPKTLATAVIGGMLAFGGPLSVLADAVPVVGTSAPEFSLPSNAGGPISLQDLKGKWTVLYFYPVRCHFPHCNMQMNPALSDLLIVCEG